MKKDPEGAYGNRWGIDEMTCFLPKTQLQVYAKNRGSRNR